MAADGAEALLELSAYAAKSMGVDVPRTRYLAIRIERLQALIAEHQPEIVVCYGRTYVKYFELVCGGPFAEDGFRWSGQALCTLSHHPYQAFGASPPPEFWVGLGRELRRRVDERRRA